jgi:hypothetical protein
LVRLPGRQRTLSCSVFLFIHIKQQDLNQMTDASKPNLETPKIEQVSEYRNTTRRGSEPAPPDAAKALKGTTTREGIEQAAEARRQQSRSWADRDVGPRSSGNRDSK